MRVIIEDNGLIKPGRSPYVFDRFIKRIILGQGGFRLGLISRAH